MTHIFFLGLCKSKTEIHIDEKHRHNIPTPTSRVKEVKFSCVSPEEGDLLYVHNAQLDEEKNLIIHAFTKLPCEEPTKVEPVTSPPGYRDPSKAPGIRDQIEDPSIPPADIL